MDNSISNFIMPISIPTPFEVGDVTVYLIVDEKIVLVDCGHYSEDAYEKIELAFEEQGLSIRDLDEIWLTHGHPDHYGQAARLAEQSGALVFGHPKERANFAGNSDAGQFEELFVRHGIPRRYIENMVKQLEWLQQFQVPLEPKWIDEGDTLHSGKNGFKVKLTPGHAPGHVCFVNDEEVILGGDLLLGHISTNALINFDATTGKRNPSLLQYRDSLAWVGEQEKTVLPGHGNFISNPDETVGRYLDEQEVRYRRISRLLSERPMGLVDLSRHMFPDALNKGAHFLVLSEVLGYLDWGEHEGSIQRKIQHDKILYMNEGDDM